MIINRDIAERVPVFQHMGADVYLRLVQRLGLSTYLPGEFIVKQGDLGDAIFFIKRGKVDAVLPNGVTVFLTLKPGDFFGERSMLFLTRRDASFRAVDFVDLYVMHRPDFTELYVAAPDFIREVQRVDKEREHQRLLYELSIARTSTKAGGGTASAMTRAGSRWAGCCAASLSGIPRQPPKQLPHRNETLAAATAVEAS
jgi:CRP-like cAMP-binding protein